MSEEAKLYQKESKWYAVYTKPRWEKKTAALLLQKGLESYCPLNRVVKQWSDRKKKVEEPLFTSYVFVHITEAQKEAVRRTEGVVNFVYWLGKPAVIDEKEIDAIRDFVQQHENIKLEALSLRPGQEIEISHGLLKGKKGRVTRLLGNKIEIVLEQLQVKMVAGVEKGIG